MKHLSDIVESIKKYPKDILKKDFCSIFGVESKKLHYLLNKYPEKKRYKIFKISKKNGGERIISTPCYNIKKSQKKLVEIINELYFSKKSSFAYIKNKDIKDHAKFHLDKSIKNIVRIDIKDFFPSIHFGRILGIFLNHPFSLNKEVAVFLSNLCCYEQKLPQGAPTSPILSDLACRTLDNKLRKIAKESNCFYTRYADDIYFSTNLKNFDNSIGKVIKNTNTFMLSDKIKNIFIDNNFLINEEKTYFMNKSHRQVITGVVINKHLTPSRGYIKLVRAMIHTWEKKGLGFSQKYFSSHYNSNKSGVHTRFENFLLGRINHMGYIRGYNDRIYLKYAKRLSDLYKRDNLKGFKFSFPLNEGGESLEIKNPLYSCIINTEGETDSHYIKSALNWFHKRGEYIDLKIVNFHNKTSDSKLLEYYQHSHKRSHNKTREICLFDADSRSIMNKVTIAKGGLDESRNNCFSLITPIPTHRIVDYPFCMELYFKDKDLHILDNDGRRIFLKSEFQNQDISNKEEIFKNNDLLLYIKAKKTLIVEKVYSIADNKEIKGVLSKSLFAENISKRNSPFDNIDFSGFNVLFDKIITICKQ